MATAKGVSLTHDREFGVTDPLDSIYRWAAAQRHCMPWTILRASNPIVRRQPARIGKLTQGFLFKGAACHSAT